MAAPFLSVFVLFLFRLLVTVSRVPPALGAVPRFGALDHAAVLPGLAPRWYPAGIAAVPAQPVSPNPRHLHLLSGRDDELLVARQSQCSAGFHSCVEAGAAGAGLCCSNDRYCYLNDQWQAMCCSLGVTCPDSVCDAGQLYCNQTSTITVPVATPTTTSGRSGVVNVTSSLSYSVYASCCNRPCGSESFSCEPLFGGRCCPYNFKCATGGSCIGDPAPSTTAPGGCAIPCDGGGCCNSGSICTTQSLASATSTGMCVLNNTIAGVTSNGLSSGAKAGIGVGVAVGAALIIAAATWVCIKNRNRKKAGAGATGTNASAHEMRQSSGADGGRREEAGTSLLAGPMTPWTYRSTTGPEYFGPDAGIGPFTERDEDRHAAAVDSALATTPPTQGSPGGAGGAYFSPGSIRRPVELGENEAQMEKEKDKETQVEETSGFFGPFELMGSPGSPSPLTSGDKGPPSPFPAEAGAGEK